MKRIATLISILFFSTAIAGCDDDKPKGPAAGCDEALNRATQMLSVPDIDAAKDWTARAKTLCGSTGEKSVKSLEDQIAQTVAAKDKRTTDANDKVAVALKGIADYRGQKGREACKLEDADENKNCIGTADAPGVQIQGWTRKGDANIFSIFTTVPKRGLGCDVFGGADMKKTRGTGETKASYCGIKSGPLAGLDALIEPSSERPTTDLYVFSPSWIDGDAPLLERIHALDLPP